MATKKFVIEVEEGRTPYCNQCPLQYIDCFADRYNLLDCAEYNLATMKIKEYDDNEGKALLYAVEKTAERTKREVINKAVEWLKEEMHYKDHSSGRGSWGEIKALGTYDSLEEFFNEFKQAMEDEK